MRIGIDISQIVYQGTGVANYTKNLVENLLKVDKKNEYVLFFSSLRRKLPELDLKPQTSNLKQFKFPPTLLEFLWNRLHIMPLEKLIGEVDIFHSSDWTQPPTKTKKVTTIHDLVVYKYPESLHPKIVATQKRRLKWVRQECDLVIADSVATKNDIIEILGIPKEKIRVIYLAADERFKPQPEKEVERIKRKYKIKGDYILSVGTREPRKNLKGVVKAFAKLSNLKMNLIIAGGFGWGRDIKNVKCQMSNVKLLGFVPQEELPALYSGASCFVYPSFYEGFGLPVLEALSCGCPVVTSCVSSLPEVAGNAAVLVDPENTDEIAEGIKKAIRNRKALAKKGLVQAKKFSWKKTAKKTLAVYKEVVKC